MKDNEEIEGGVAVEDEKIEDGKPLRWLKWGMLLGLGKE